MKATVRFAVYALGFLTASTTANGQFDKLQPASYGVWAPQVGSGAIYQLESKGKKEFLEVAIVGTEKSGPDIGYWLESHMMTSDQRELSATKRLVVASHGDVKTVSFIFQLSPPKPDALRIDNSFLNDLAGAMVRVSGPGEITKDIRNGSKRVGTENVQTQAGTYKCEVWRLKKGGAVIWYSPQVHPLGLVKLESDDGAVLLKSVIADAKERMFIVSVDNRTTQAVAESKALYEAFPGVWSPLVGSGANYQLTRKAKKQDIELVVISTMPKGQQINYRLEVVAPCFVRGFSYNIDYPPQPDIRKDIITGKLYKYGTIPGRSGTERNDVSYDATCTNEILLSDTGLVDSIANAFLTGNIGYPGESRFSIPFMLANFAPVSTRTGFPFSPVQVKVSPHEAPTLFPQDSALSDFRKRATHIGKEKITVPAGSFECEHWRSSDGQTDVWLNLTVTPFGVVRSSSAAGELALTGLIKSSPSRPTAKQRPPSKFDTVELRPHK